MNKFMIDILLQGLDNETRMKLLPREQEIKKQGTKTGDRRNFFTNVKLKKNRGQT